MADFESIVKSHAKDGVIPAEAIATLVAAIKTAVGNEYVDKERYKAKLTEIDQLKEQQQTAEDNATTASKWEDKYKTLKGQFDDYKADVAKKETLSAKKDKLTKIAKDAGLTEAGVAKALKYTDFGKIELDEKGEVKNAADIIKGLKEEWPEYIGSSETHGADVPNPPPGNKPDYDSMSDADYYKATYEANKKGK